MKNKIDVALTFDGNRWKTASITIISLLKNRGGAHYAIHCVMTPELYKNQDVQRQMKEIVAGLDKESSIDFIPFDYKNASIPYNKNMAYGGGVCYYKMDLFSLLPDVDKVIQLDDDIIVLRPLDELMKIDMGGNYMMVFAPGNAFRLSADRKKYKDMQTFNAGVVVMNLAAIRESKVHESFPKIFENKDLFFEQGLMAVAFAGKMIMHPNDKTLYNYRIHCDWAKGRDIAIIHYTGKKPWFFPVRRMTTWWKYAKLSPFYKEFRRNAIHNFFVYLLVMPIPFKRWRHKLRNRLNRV
ncbi:MAG: hypothetical protein LBH81_02935 [Rickettsiales bacterium]|jgi:lipopolysaccharide biosynthesis glycosyltransferase|nr:hypothetical protein [Rickettsiales bacterium]